MRFWQQHRPYPLSELVHYVLGNRREKNRSRLNMSFDELTPEERALLERVGRRAGYVTGRDFLKHLQTSKAQQHR